MTAQVLLDASFWIALRDPREPRHGQARRAAARLLRQRTRFVFTSFVLAETHAYFSRSPASAQRRFWTTRNKTRRCIGNRSSQSDETAAVALLRQHRDKEYSLCDAISFVVMRRLGISPGGGF